MDRTEWSFEFNVPLTTRSWRRDLSLKSHHKDWRSGGSNQWPQPLRHTRSYGSNGSETFHLKLASHSSLLIKTITINKTDPEEKIIRVVLLLNKEIKFQQPCFANLNPLVRNCHLFTQSDIKACSGSLIFQYWVLCRSFVMWLMIRHLNIFSQILWNVC